ncbi:hypothetical protein HMPREF9123_2391 [Neisseria bacilliformis ATCC BAA-1200]|uniref:Uncharacterized protein n=1 Tax=Neisseria bacilliformis ATCC BAA-1200 TaxID=888742 RepID=F2BF84_9NEIS|nr:hypothetical protein HMPREF9123_2391 [Neisseria bacilliformis ATCC BAA-1200]
MCGASHARIPRISDGLKQSLPPHRPSENAASAQPKPANKPP